MYVGMQFNGSLNANQTKRWFTFNWPQEWHVIWYVVPVTPAPGTRQIEWHVEVERASASKITYWIVVKNLTNQAISVEGRYAVLN
jgi:hypothetical protein